MSSGVPTQPEALLSHADFVRGLARSLLADEGTAEDVAQDALVAALERPPEERGRTRGWFAAVVRNLARQSWRSTARRERREAAAARPERIPGPAEIVEREAVRRHVVEAVLALEEPYRTAVILRYYEELEPGEIARKIGCPPETVRTRLHRAHAMLRERLDGEHGGDRRAWAVALVPLAGRRPEVAGALGAAGGGAIAMGTLQKFAVATGVLLLAVGGAALVLGGAGGAGSRPEDARRRTSLAPTTGSAGTGSPADSSVAAVPRGGGRAVPAAGGGAATGPGRAAAPSGSPSPRRGRVVDAASGSPVPGALILRRPETGGEREDLELWGLSPHSPLAQLAAEDGCFDASTGHETSEWVAIAPGRGCSDWTRASAQGGLVLQVTEGNVIEGTVLEDRTGLPMPGVRVTIGTASSDWGGPEVTSGPDGRYRLAGVPPGLATRPAVDVAVDVLGADGRAWASHRRRIAELQRAGQPWEPVLEELVRAGDLLRFQGLGNKAVRDLRVLTFARGVEVPQAVPSVETRTGEVLAWRDALREAGPGTKQRAEALGRLRNALRSTDPSLARAAADGLESLARGGHLDPEEAESLAGDWRALVPGAPARASLAAAVARALAEDERRRSFLGDLPRGEEPEVREAVVRVLDHVPTDASRTYLVGLWEEERSESVLRAALDEDRATFAATRSTAPRLVAAAERRFAAGDVPDSLRDRVLCALAIAGLQAPEAAVAALGRIATSERDPGLQAFAREAARQLEAGEATSKSLDRLRKDSGRSRRRR
ncbi:MAG: sigma-70 family RNA polymerase sigma factor [Planctomycetales bacterium]|nr:sigma-70 family RNA polymerase sigma factor [Planctomycetales bacterium]